MLLYVFNQVVIGLYKVFIGFKEGIVKGMHTVLHAFENLLSPALPVAFASPVPSRLSLRCFGPP